MKILVTGGCGFIGSNFIRLLLQGETDDQVINLDALTYAGNEANLEDLGDHRRYAFVKGDICDGAAVDRAIGSGVDAVVHLAAETHVDRSILGPAAFVRTNVLGTQSLLEIARQRRIGCFVHVSTDEVYGPAGPNGPFAEGSRLAPTNPYAASKAAADLLVQSYVITYGMPAIIVRPTNTYGPYQFPEKVIPLFITNGLEGRDLPLYGDGQHVREWLYVEDHCEALARVLRGGRPGEVYNIGGGQECTNLALAQMIVRAVGVQAESIRFVKDRPGHDRRYALSSEKIAAELGWRPQVNLEQGLARTVAWYREHRAWWRPLKGESFQAYYRGQYGPGQSGPAAPAAAWGS